MGGNEREKLRKKKGKHKVRSTSMNTDANRWKVLLLAQFRTHNIPAATNLQQHGDWTCASGVHSPRNKRQLACECIAAFESVNTEDHKLLYRGLSKDVMDTKARPRSPPSKLAAVARW